MNKIIDRDFYLSSLNVGNGSYSSYDRSGGRCGPSAELITIFPAKRYDEECRGKIILPNVTHEEVQNLRQIMYGETSAGRLSGSAIPRVNLTISADVLTVRAELESLKKRVLELEKML